MNAIDRLAGPRVDILRLGRRGDGIAETASGSLYVPYALPGETVVADRQNERGRLISLIVASRDRIDPVCRHFTICGGCAVQAWAFAPYAAWKRNLLVEALARAGVAADVSALVDAHGTGRRRATFHARRSADGDLRVGFMRARAHETIAIESCPVLDPRLDGALPAARAIAQALSTGNKPLDLLVTATETGIDVNLRGQGSLGEAQHARLCRVAADHDLARLSNHGTIVLERRRPVLTIGEASVAPPPGMFLQATAAGETALAERVLEAASGAKKIADLFAGLGTFALRLAGRADVTAYDTEAPALAALERAAKAAALRSTRTEARDLFRRPLDTGELGAFDTIVLDPPRAGAEAQMRAIAASTVERVISVACDVDTFARDAAILLAAGFTVGRIAPIDQFRYSPHLEIFAVFRRPPAKRKRRLLG